MQECFEFPVLPQGGAIVDIGILIYGKNLRSHSLWGSYNNGQNRWKLCQQKLFFERHAAMQSETMCEGVERLKNISLMNICTSAHINI